MKKLILILGLFTNLLSLHAGDGNPFAPKKMVMELENPFKDQPRYKSKESKLILVYKPKGPDDYEWQIGFAVPQSLEINTGAERFIIPPEILKDIKWISLDTLAFDWESHRYRLKFHAALVGKQDNTYGDFLFIWEEGKLSELSLEGKDLKSRYPQVFKKK